MSHTFEAVTMATAQSVPDLSKKVMEEGLTCYICYNLLREPKDLECSHVYCLQCLQEWVKKKPTVECPECRRITVIPQGGLVNLKTNLRLKTMVDNYVHGGGKRERVPLCPNHEGERQHFFCVTCGITVCHNCLVFDHPRPQHNIKELKVIAKTRKGELKTKMKHIQEEIKGRKKEKQELDEIERTLQAAKEKAETGIKKQVQQVMSKVKAKECQMMALVETNYQKNLTTLRKKQNHTEDTIYQLENVHSTAQSEIDTGADHNLLRRHAPLVNQMDSLCLAPQTEMASLDMDSLIFYPGSGLQDMFWFGHVGAYRQPPLAKAKTRQTEAPSMNVDSVRVNPGSSLPSTSQVGHVGTNSKNTCKLKRISEFGEFRWVMGVAATRTGLLAVVNYDARYVSIYHKDNGNFKRQYRLGSHRNVTRPEAVAATSDGKFFISDDGVVKVFSPDGRYERSWRKSVDASRITTTPDDMIVIGDHKKEVISVHQSNGKLIKTHQADCADIVDIASNGRQIAFTTTGYRGKVCVIDFVTGHTLWTVDMEEPRGICYEQKSNTLLVAGGSWYQGENVIQQYCSTTGHLISRLASDLYWPCGMTTTHDSKLVVADENTVKVYQIEYE